MNRRPGSSCVRSRDAERASRTCRCLHHGVYPRHRLGACRRGERLFNGGLNMPDRTYNVLFLCTGNTARSILAEGILRRDGAGRFNAYSAGSQPKGVVNPLALKVLKSHAYPTDGFRSKGWEEFAVPDAPQMDFVFTVCDSAAAEACPIWLGHPGTAHWGIEDPATVEGSDLEKERAFVQAFKYLRNRIGAFISLPLASLDAVCLQARLDQIGRAEGATPAASAG